ncbi:MAG: hypothetical protein KDD69_12555, partial [Bdellovibrionales bacterium]|nr:hypothetical protein [Bdellovibrionales bacterium]
MRRLLSIFLIITTAVAICGPVGDPDLWWHLVIGRWILHHRTLPSVDLWNAFSDGVPWRAYSWSNEVLYAAVHDSQLWGDYGLLTCKVLLALVFVASTAWCAIRLSGSPFFGLLLGLGASAASYAHFGLRPQVVSWICFVWLLYLAERIRRDGIRPRQLVAAGAIAMVWANSHLTAVVGIGATIVWLFDFTRPRETWKDSAKVAFAILLGTLLTPYLGAEWFTAAGKAEHPFANMYITEFQPATLYHAGANAVILLFAVLIVFAHVATTAVTASQLTGAVLFLFGALTVQKFIPFAALFQAMLVARVWASADAERGELGNLGVAFRKLEQLASSLGTGSTVALIAITVLLIAGLARPLVEHPLDRKTVAIAPMDFIFEQNLPLPLLNNFNDGGYVLYRYAKDDGTPGYRVPLDGRTNVNAPQVVQAFLNTLYGRTDWRRYIEVVQAQTILWENAFPLVSILLESKDWCHLY